MKLRLLVFSLLLSTFVTAQSDPTLKQAEEFMRQAEARLNELSIKVNRASWIEDNFITDDTQAMSADAQDEATAVTTELVEEARRFDKLQMPPDLARKFKLLRLSLTAPAPKDPALQGDDAHRRIARRRLRKG